MVKTVYHIHVFRPSAGDEPVSLTLDGAACQEEWIPLVDDHNEHSIEVSSKRVYNGQWACRPRSRPEAYDGLRFAPCGAGFRFRGDAARGLQG